MSHITTVDLLIQDLDALSKACEQLGLELVRDQKTFKWFGRFVGDTVPPAGLDVKNFGKCEHAIRVKGAGAQTYEIGLVKRADGKGYTVAFDYWKGGFGLMEKVSYNGSTAQDTNKLKDWYAAEVTRKTMKKQGFSVMASQQDRKVQVLCSK